MIDLAYVHFGIFDYFLDGEDVTEDAVAYFNGFADNTNLLELELAPFFELSGRAMQTIFIDYDNAKVFATSFRD